MGLDMLPNYEIYGIRYATNEGRKRGQNYILEADPTAPLVLDFYCWVLKSEDRLIVVDTGMNAETARQHGHQMLVSLPAVWRDLGVEADQVDTVIMTHLHFDHAGNMDHFPKARFHMQAEEMHYVTGEWMGRPWFRRAYEVDEICQAVRLLHQGRLHLHGREAEIAKGITAHWVGGHCAGQEILRVHTARGWVVLASDALHYYEEYQRSVPFAVAFNLSDMIKGHELIRDLADSDDHVLPAHDPLIAKIYPAAGIGPEGAVYRLDLAPQVTPRSGIDH